MDIKGRIEPVALLIMLISLVVILGCNLPYNLNFGTPSATPTLAPALTPAPTRPSGCLVPNVVGQDVKMGEAALTAAGLTALKTTVFSDAVPAGVIRSQQPAAGASLDPCQGEVTIEISLGPAAPSPSPEASATATLAPSATLPAASATVVVASATATPSQTRPAASPTPNGPPLKNSENYDLLYFNNFPQRDAYGLTTERWKQIVVRPGSTVSSVNGRLQIKGKMELYGGGAFQHRVRLLIGGGKYGVGLADFTVFVDYQDAQNNLRMACTDAAASGLSCEWLQRVAGAETKLSAAPISLCSGACDLQIELDQGEIRVAANDVQRASLHNATFATGQIGLSVDAPAAANFSLDQIVVYEIPKDAVAKVLFREDFGGDFSLDPTDSAYSTITLAQSEGFLKIKALAKQGVFYYQPPYNSVDLPEAFTLNLSARLLSGAKTAALGLIFQISDKDHYAVALLSYQGMIEILAKINGEWKTIQAPSAAAGFKAGEANTLTVKGSGSQYTVQLNGKTAASFREDNLSSGYFGIAAQLDAAGDSLQAEIYQLEARR